MKKPKPRKKIKHPELWYNKILNTPRIVMPNGNCELGLPVGKKIDWVLNKGLHWDSFARQYIDWVFLGEIK